MKKNLPATQTEHKMRSDEILVSRTDLMGRITYANSAFCKIAGFEEHELLGKAHNIVRHPDMSASAFQDLWDTLKDKKPWSGIVKNRCKNGDYYWVVGNASPEHDKHGNVCSYISVRTAPTQTQIDFAADLYQKVNAGQASVPSTLAANWYRRMRIGTLLVTTAIISIIGCASQ